MSPTHTYANNQTLSQMIRMMVNVRTYGDLMRALGGLFTLELKPGATLRELVSELSEKMGTEKRNRLGHHDLKGSSLMVLVNGRNIHSLHGLDTSLRNGDTVTFIPLVEGG